MATLSTVFRSDAARIHSDHRSIVADLASFDAALNRLECHSEVFANLAGAGQVLLYGRRLLEKLPEHFEREEETVLAKVSEVSPQLAQFAAQMTQEHAELRNKLAGLAEAFDRLDLSDDLYEAICAIKDDAKALLQQLGRHVALEEHELEGFL